MISIAICDDDRALTGSLESMLREDAALYGLTVSCDVFFDGASLVEASETGRPVMNWPCWTSKCTVWMASGLRRLSGTWTSPS